MLCNKSLNSVTQSMVTNRFNLHSLRYKTSRHYRNKRENIWQTLRSSNTEHRQQTRAYWYKSVFLNLCETVAP